MSPPSPFLLWSAGGSLVLGNERSGLTQDYSWRGSLRFTPLSLQLLVTVISGVWRSYSMLTCCVLSRRLRGRTYGCLFLAHETHELLAIVRLRATDFKKSYVFDKCIFCFHTCISRPWAGSPERSVRPLAEGARYSQGNRTRNYNVLAGSYYV